MAHTAVARSNRDIFELHVHVVFRCVSNMSAFSTKRFGRGGRRSGKDEPSRSLPRYTWPDVISRVTTWPWKGELSARTLWQSSGLELSCQKAGVWYWDSPAPRSVA